jgi:uncharacterized protein (DUF1800 family)
MVRSEGIRKTRNMSALHARLLFAVLLPLAAAAAAGEAPAPEVRALHVLDRLGYGPAPGDLPRVMQIGVDAYIEEQLHPEQIADPPELVDRLARLETLSESPAQLYASVGPPKRREAKNDDAALKQVQQRQNAAVDEAREARLLRAIYSPAQLRESMVDFWFNHFNVAVNKGQEVAIWVGAYERDAIRPYVLGRFRDLLGATARHPAMLYYLDNWQSSVARSDKNGKVIGGLNENYARELMELHTLGVDGGYTQRDVTELARILTGWGFNPKDLEAGRDPAFRFDANRHDKGAKQFLGEKFAAGGGVEEGERALDLLAHHPATAHHLAWQLAQYFVADDPPGKLVERLAQRFRNTDGDIAAVLEALFKSEEFWQPRYTGNKFKTPYQYIVSAMRASGLPMPLNVRPLIGNLAQSGEPLYQCLTPDGYKNTQEAWLSPDVMLYRLNFANALGGGYGGLYQAPQPPVEVAANAMSAAPSMSAPSEDAPKPPPKPLPPDPFVMQAALGNRFSLATAQALADARPGLRPGLMLGSPEFMHR